MSYYGDKMLHAMELGIKPQKALDTLEFINDQNLKAQNASKPKASKPAVKMIKHKILFKNLGEISYTAFMAYKPAPDLPLDYTEDDTRLYSSDDFRLCTCKVAEVRIVELPDYISPALYCREQFRIDKIWQAHKKAKATLTEVQFWGMLHIIEHGSYELMRESVKLLCANLRSNFKMSLKSQLEKWLNDMEAGIAKYRLPFSYKQIDALTRYCRKY